jgi:hypothetical protein
LSDQGGVEFDLLEEALEPSIVGLDLRSTRKGGGNLGEIDRFDLEQAHYEIREAFNASQMPVGKVEFQDMGEYGRLRHGVVELSRCATVLSQPYFRSHILPISQS